MLIASICLTVVFKSTPAHADYGLPSWWNNQTCDNTAGHNYGAVLAGTWNGLQSCKGGNYYPTTFGGQWPHGVHEWECVELVFRYLYDAYGQTVYSLGNNNPGGKDIVNDYPSNPGKPLQKIPNTHAQSQGPQTGDVLSFGPYKSNLAGHAAIVTQGVPSGGTGDITIFQQNGGGLGPFFPKLHVTNYVVDDPGQYGLGGVINWLHNSNPMSASLKVASGVTVTSPQPLTLGGSFSSTYVVTNSGDSNFWMTQLSLWGQDPNGNAFMIYSDNNGGGNIYVGAHSTRTLNTFVQNFASNCSNCVAGTYNILAEYQDTNNGAYHLIGPNGGTNPVAINVTANGIPNNKLTSGQTLNSGQRLTSDNGAVFLAMQSDGNLVEYVTSTGRVLWASNTNGHPGTILVNQSSDGNMVLYAPGAGAIWATNVYGIQNLMLVVQNDGNVVVYTPQGQPVWATGTNFL